ncbi:hypothetical protein [Pseudopontixanthobacter vadosimaris]|uniref:hypothetical protein n=1 Tax=Pseudopontixanthobacter vadosimaris TaxID=2726450 RepID=UPI00147565DF|nr:hypothetical protein [Pseudopontixanthobacter vadosimaris]
MRKTALILALCVAAASAPAAAACAPSFVDDPTTVQLTPGPSFDREQLFERLNVRVRNEGDDPCLLRFNVTDRTGSVADGFPAISIVGPNGIGTSPGSPAIGSTASFGAELAIPANGQVVVPLEVRTVVGWGSRAGLYNRELELQLLNVQTAQELGSRRTQLTLTIPRTALIRFAGAGGTDGPPRIEMGPLSPVAPTRSPPFALRILSTSPYLIDVTSDNNGSLRREGASDLIPYRMTLGGQEMMLAGSRDSMQVGRHTNSVGDVLPVTIVTQPDPEYHAGQYQDRITITVTTN